jgi:hypothetical protein
MKNCLCDASAAFFGSMIQFSEPPFIILSLKGIFFRIMNDSELLDIDKLMGRT